MDAQLSLFDPPPKQGPGDSVFLAIPIKPVPGLTASVGNLWSRYELDGTLRSSTLHISLLGVGTFDHIPASRLARVEEPGLATGLGAFRLTFTDAMSFPAKAGAKSPLVLPVDDAEALRALVTRLQHDLLLRDIKLSARPPALFHVTLLYDHRIVSERAPLLAPITLKVDHFVLVRSLFGKATHIELASYPLG